MRLNTGPDPRQIDSFHDRYGNYIGHCRNVVTEVEILKAKYALDSLDWKDTIDEDGRALGYSVIVRKGGNIGTALSFYLEDAAAMAVSNMEKKGPPSPPPPPSAKPTHTIREWAQADKKKVPWYKFWR